MLRRLFDSLTKPFKDFITNQLNKLRVAFLTHPHDMPRRIELCRQALAIVEREASPKEWALWKGELAYSLWQNPLGSRADNLEEAIMHYKQALEVLVRQAFPKYWAITQNNLANAYLSRIRGERCDNLEQAIHHYKQALEVRTRQAYPAGWAQTQNNLALALSNRIREERADNLEQAIFHYKQALEVRTRQAFPADWAQTQNNLALAFKARIRGIRADNFEQAIFHAKQALKVYTRQAFPEYWAMTQNNLALALSNRIRGKSADNLEQAIYHYEQVLEVYTRQAFPADWAQTQNNLANAYQDRIRGERADNLEQAIHHHKQALEVRTRQAYPADWAHTQNNLANAYQDRIRGERADNLEQAIDHHKQALEIRTRQAYPADWAHTQNNLANAYQSRIKGERGGNLERAISHYKQALEIRTRQAFPADWAMTQNNLAIAYQNRIKQERADNLEQAIHHYGQVLKVYTRQAFPEYWAVTQNNLATAYQDRIRGERGDNLEQAISHYKQALEIRTREAFPEGWAMTQNNLATAYLDHIKGEPGNNLEQAIYHCKQALEIRTQEAFPEGWAETQNNLAIALKDHIKGERGDNLKQPITHYKQALNVFTPHSFPQKCRNTAYWLGHLLYDEQRFNEAREALVTAHEAVEALRGEARREATKRELAAENADLYARLVACCLHDGDEAAAFEYAVAGKGRLFVDLLDRTPLDFASFAIQKPELAADWRQAGELRQKVDQLLIQLNPKVGEKEERRAQRAEVYRQLRAEQAALNDHWQEMSWKYPILSATSSAPTLSAAQACELASELDAMLVEYVRHAQGWGAFVVSASELRYVPLPLVDDALLGKMENWVKRLKTRLGRGRFSCKPLRVWHRALIAPLSLPSPLDSNGKGEKKRAALVLAPFGRLHLLPLAALRAADEAPYLAAEYNLSFVPTLGALQALRDEHNKDESATSTLQAQKLLSVAYPGTPPLPNVLPEAEAITGYFAEATPLHDTAATPDAVLEAAPGKQIIHLGCHGRFDSEHPTESGLMLAGGWLTVQRIITELNLKESSLTTLAACESGKSHVRSGDEHVGLTQAIMTAGAKSVVASLWNVNDAATRALFEAFYANLTQAEAPIFALQHAQLLVRQRAHWQHPYYWAAFTVSGLAYHSTLRQAQGTVNSGTTNPPIHPASSKMEPTNPPTHTYPAPLGQPTNLPINLSEHLDQLNQTSRQGGPSMNAEQMKAEYHSVLEQMIEYPSEIQAALDPNEAVILLDALDAVTEHTCQAKNEADLLVTAHAIQTLVEELPSLRQLLLEEHSDIVKLQEERGVTLQNFKNTAQGNKEEQAAIPNTINELVEARDALAKYQPDSPPLVPNKENWLNRLLKKMGIK